MFRRISSACAFSVRGVARWIAGGGTLLAGLAVLSVGVGTLAQAHGRFSVGVGLMLVLYAGLVITLAVALLRGVSAVRGAVVGAGLLHVIVVASLASSGAPQLWWAEPLLVATVVAAVALIPPRTATP